jgi:hypothetical protein
LDRGLHEPWPEQTAGVRGTTTPPSTVGGDSAAAAVLGTPVGQTLSLQSAPA